MVKDKYNAFKLEMDNLLAAQATRREVLKAEHGNIKQALEARAIAICKDREPEAFLYKPNVDCYFNEHGVEVNVTDEYYSYIQDFIVTWEELEC